MPVDWKWDNVLLHGSISQHIYKLNSKRNNMKKASILIPFITFFIGMWFGAEVSNFIQDFSKDKQETEMVTEEHSVTTLSQDACLEDFYVVDQNIVELAQSAEQEMLLSDLVQTLHNDANTLTLRHNNFTLEYLAIKSLPEELIVTSTKRYDWINYKKLHGLYAIQARLPILYLCIEPFYYYHFNKTFELAQVAYIETKARSPGEVEIPYGRITPIQQN